MTATGIPTRVTITPTAVSRLKSTISKNNSRWLRTARKKKPSRESKDSKSCQRRARIVRNGGALKTESDEMYWACYDYIFPEDIPEGQTWLDVREERKEEWHEAGRVAQEVFEAECMESAYGWP